MLKSIYRLWFGRQPASALGLFRICFGLVLLATTIYDLGEAAKFYSGQGFIPGEYVPGFFREARFSVLDSFQSPEAVYFWYAALIISAFLFTIGYKTNYVKIIQFILLLSFHERNFLILNSGDTLLRVMAFYLAISPCGKAFSIDSLLSKRKELVEAWHIRLMQVQLALVYLFAGIAKFGTAPWMDGSAVNYILMNGIFNRFGMDWIAAVPLIALLATWASLAFELAFPLLIWIEKARKPLLISGAALHFSILLLIDVGFFSLITIACYPVFLKPGEAESIARTALKLWHRIRQAFSRKTAASL